MSLKCCRPFMSPVVSRGGADGDGYVGWSEVNIRKNLMLIPMTESKKLKRENRMIGPDVHFCRLYTEYTHL